MGVKLLNAGLGAAVGLALLVGGCAAKHEEPKPPAPPMKAMKPAPATPIAIKKIELGEDGWDPAWDKIVEEAIPASMLSYRVPHDVRQFCPRFYGMGMADKRAFWAYFFQALAGAEAGLNPTSRVRHTEPQVAVKDAVTGRMVRSQGLMQLTYEDQRRYGCDFDWEADRKLTPDDPEKTILQPKNNLECGVKILARQIIEMHKPLLSRTGYWSTLRPGNQDYRMFAKQMTNPPSACGLHERTVKQRRLVARR
ncbi:MULTISPECIES: hypothetical protein [Acidobacteriaceae]|uniref:hypothetical protein n=1 Tax=Acidobacteriaceae TaxID=204434 RepID=UPI00131DE7F2|nr:MULTISPECIES: hypothetical protein [Acidobacteriaceae]MDW5265858.1 hypothetical protein [Edaphobacter sp.]